MKPRVPYQKIIIRWKDYHVALYLDQKDRIRSAYFTTTDNLGIQNKGTLAIKLMQSEITEIKKDLGWAIKEELEYRRANKK